MNEKPDVATAEMITETKAAARHSATLESPGGIEPHSAIRCCFWSLPVWLQKLRPSRILKLDSGLKH